MIKTVYLSSCPRCGGKPTVYAIRSHGKVACAVGCPEQSCRVETGFSYNTLDDTIRRWNNGIILERHGKSFVSTNTPRTRSTMVVEI